MSKVLLEEDAHGMHSLSCSSSSRLEVHVIILNTTTKIIEFIDLIMNLGVNNVMFHEDNIIVGLDGPFVYHWYFFKTFYFIIVMNSNKYELTNYF
jgi:hypothetical protein